MCIWRDERENRERKDEERGGSEARGALLEVHIPIEGMTPWGIRGMWVGEH